MPRGPGIGSLTPRPCFQWAGARIHFIDALLDPGSREPGAANALGRASHLRGEKCFLNTLARQGKVCLLPKGTAYLMR